MVETILVVDDNEMNRKLLHAMLSSEGYQTVQAEDGIEALMHLEQRSVDAVISDILMPNMDGYRLCYEIRKNEQFRSLPLILYTSTYTEPRDEKLALQVGADRYITKPAPRETILQALKDLSAGRNGRPANGTGPAADVEVMKQYSEVLVQKLEKKNSDLEKARRELTKLNQQLAGRVRERTAELEAANKDLQMFSYTVAHDLQHPLAVITGLSALLLDNGDTHLSNGTRESVQQISQACQSMTDLIRNTLALSRVAHGDLQRQPVELSALAKEVAASLQGREPERQMEFIIQNGITADGDPGFLRVAMENLLGNAWKYSSKQPAARIEFGVTERDGRQTYFVRDNGAGFDQADAGKLFAVFRRLHHTMEFPGTGVGLVSVQHVVHRHGGEIWAEARKNQGATFYFTLGEQGE